MSCPEMRSGEEVEAEDRGKERWGSLRVTGLCIGADHGVDPIPTLASMKEEEEEEVRSLINDPMNLLRPCHLKGLGCMFQVADPNACQH